MINETAVRRLLTLVRAYDGQTKAVTAAKNRAQASLGLKPPEAAELPEVRKMESVKNAIGREVLKQLELWPVYSEWLAKVPGLGPYVCGNLVLLYYYRWVPICKKCGADLVINPGAEDNYCCSSCGKEAKGDGILRCRIECRDFPTISKWWKFMGRDVSGGGIKRKRRGEKIDFSPRGRLVGYTAYRNFNYSSPGKFYRDYMDHRKRLAADKHPKLPKYRIASRGGHETAKLLLAHFWVVARTLDGLPVSKPYIHTVGGHTNYVSPPYFDKEISYIEDVEEVVVEGMEYDSAEDVYDL